MNCENHPDRPAKWLRNSWIIGQPQVAVCDECKSHYEDLNLADFLYIQPIVTEKKNVRQI
jgi:hypothetical protein